MAWEPDYVTSVQFKDYLRNKNADDTVDDVHIGRAITAGARSVDRFCGQNTYRQFGLLDAPEARYYTPRWSEPLIRWVIEIDDLMDPTGLMVQLDTDRDDIYESTVTNYILRPQDALAKQRPYTQIAIGVNSSVQPNFFRYSAKVTGRFGWLSFPTSVVLANEIQAHAWFKRRQAPFGTAGSPSKGTAKDRQGPDVVIDPDVEAMLRTYVKLRWTP